MGGGIKGERTRGMTFNFRSCRIAMMRVSAAVLEEGIMKPSFLAVRREGMCGVVVDMLSSRMVFGRKQKMGGKKRRAVGIESFLDV